MKITLTILGSASGLQTRNRFNSAIVVGVGQERYLFDCGEPATALLLRAGVDFDRIPAVFITHLHADHCGGLGQFVQYLQLSRRQSPLRLFLPAEAVVGMRAYLEMLYLFPAVLPFALELCPVREGLIFQDERIQVQAQATSHFKRFVRDFPAPPCPNPGQSFAYRIGMPAGPVVYSGDIGCMEDLASLLVDARILILEAAHLNVSAMLEWLTQGRFHLSKIILTHLHPKWEGRENDLAREIPAALRNVVVVAYDGYALAEEK